ncbi:MAG: lysylphosphatidylglycerol synthase transmembrane domain-containing protein [Candidatus Omnitrophota bacterium]|nr:lysylphosphatidylglycerol synthase transmembrane domain-containing protein [Candidatus Omnitrophota bacterium]
MVKNKLSIILRFVISFGLLMALAWIMRKDAKEVMGIISGSNKILILLAVLINIPLSVALAYRLKLLMSGQKIFLSLRYSVYLTFIGYFFNNFLPTAIGGDIAKAHYASSKTNNSAASYAAVFADRILGLIATLLIALTGLLFIGKNMDNKFIMLAVPGLFILTVAMIALLLRKNNTVNKTTHSSEKGLFNKIKQKLIKLYTALNRYRNSPALLAKGILLSLVLQFFSIFNIYLFVLSIGGEMPFFRLLLIIPIVWTVSMLPSLNGLGVREGAFVYFLKGYIGPEKAFAVSLLWLGLIMLFSVVGGIFQLAYPLKMKKGTQK